MIWLLLALAAIAVSLALEIDPALAKLAAFDPRSVLERLGGFDEAYPAPAGEDSDLGWRAKVAGSKPTRP